jgi:hypothetical protein
MLYHATYESRVSGIMDKGLKPGIDGCVYLAGPTFAHAAQFIYIRPEHGEPVEMEINGEKHWMPTTVPNDSIYVWAIKESDLDPDLLSESFDAYLGPDSFWEPGTKCYEYNGTIDSRKLELSYQIPLGVEEEEEETCDT